MKLWFGFFTAVKHEAGRHVVTTEGRLLLADSEAEAVGSVLIEAREKYSVSKGWENHQVSMSEAPMEMLREVVYGQPEAHHS
jgi:hypothetical protein